MIKQKSRNYKDLIVWQKSIQLVVSIYDLVSRFPREEIYGITSQIKRSAVSIPSNIAEGSKRKTVKDFGHFLAIAYGSASELQTQIDIVRLLPFGLKLNYVKVDNLLDEVMRMLYVMTKKIS